MVGNKLRDTTFLIIASPTYWLSDKDLEEELLKQKK